MWYLRKEAEKINFKISVSQGPPGPLGMKGEKGLFGTNGPRVSHYLIFKLLQLLK